MKKTSKLEDAQFFKARVKELEDENMVYKEILATIFGIALIIGVIYGVNKFLDFINTPKYSIGDCLLNRAYEPVRILGVYEGSGEYSVSNQVVSESERLWYLRNGDDFFFYYRNIKFVDKTYTKINCKSIGYENQ